MRLQKNFFRGGGGRIFEAIFNYSIISPLVLKPSIEIGGGANFRVSTVFTEIYSNATPCMYVLTCGDGTETVAGLDMTPLRGSPSGRGGGRLRPRSLSSCVMR